MERKSMGDDAEMFWRKESESMSWKNVWPSSDGCRLLSYLMLAKEKKLFLLIWKSMSPSLPAVPASTSAT
jgi:hypothetical protein